MSYTSTEYTPVLRGPLEEGHKDMLTGVSNSIALTCRLMFKVTLSLGDKGYEIEVKIALFEMDVCISESERALCYAVT